MPDGPGHTQTKCPVPTRAGKLLEGVFWGHVKVEVKDGQGWSRVVWGQILAAAVALIFNYPLPNLDMTPWIYSDLHQLKSWHWMWQSRNARNSATAWSLDGP